MANNATAGLEPALLWTHFARLAGVPRPSGQEAAVRESLIAWAKERDLPCEVDAVGNLLVRAPASPGREDRPPVLLQGHIDMVAEKDAGLAFDFSKDPIQLKREGDFITAEGTTLGADNGIGVAAGMAAFDDPAVEHPPLELLFTIDEERGMTGAFGLQAGFVKATRMINMDTEEEAAIYVGCSGGGDVNAHFALETEAAPANHSALQLAITGLLGGHSGLDIIKNRGNAIRLLVRLLSGFKTPFKLAVLNGGSMRNAIPRHAEASILTPDAAALNAEIQAKEAEFKAEFKATDPDLRIAVEPAQASERVWTQDTQDRVLRALLANPSSVVSMSREVPGLVETSNNLGVVKTEGATLSVVNCTRSSVGSALEAQRDALKAIYELAGAKVEMEPSYPGWQPNLESLLLKVAQAEHQRLFQKEAAIKAIHAGLECGLIGKAFAGMDMISIGPDILGAHSPSERVSIPSTQRFYTHLKGILAAL